MTQRAAAVLGVLMIMILGMTASQLVAQWEETETWSGTTDAPAAWQPVESWMGSVWNQVSAWRSVESWSGTVENRMVENQALDNQVVVTFDRWLSGDRVAQHKVPPLSLVTMEITAEVSSQVENAVLADYFPSDWTVVDVSINFKYVSKIPETFPFLQTAQKPRNRFN